MASGGRQNGSCWTCRLRRKRCDSVQPRCGACQSLEITCHSGTTRPNWMDGGALQKQMAETIKQGIKHRATVRREQRRLAHQDQGMIISIKAERMESTGDASSSTFSPVSPVYGLNQENGPSAHSGVSTVSRNSMIPTILRSDIDRYEQSESPLTTLSSNGDHFLLQDLSRSSGTRYSTGPIPVHLGSIMIYLDYVFPFLFPFHQPSLVETGRQWLLGLLCQNEVSFHIAASLSAYFFSLLPQDDGQDMHNDCQALVRNKLVEQMEMAFKSIQKTVSAIGRQGAQSSLLDKIRTMQEITQLLIVEVMVQKSVNWLIHLTPALTLFDEVFKDYGLDQAEPAIAVLLSALPLPFAMGIPHNKPLPSTADQSALVFFVSILLFIDIMASTSLGRPPLLQSYHHSLLSSYGEGKCQIRLESVIGCPNWPLVAIGNISALCDWKRTAKQQGVYSVIDLVKYAEPISQALEEGFRSLETGTTRYEMKKMSIHRVEAYYSWHEEVVGDVSTADITRIWAFAARIYLSVSLSGWQTKSAATHNDVSQVLTMLQTIKSPARLRSLSWPIVVAGCLASPSQENSFRHVIKDIGQLVEFGTLSAAKRIMEAVWSSRDSVNEDAWDLASSLSILGSPALLL